MQQPAPPPTKIVCVTGAIAEDELRDDQEYEDILEDMRLEGRKFGNLINVLIPRPNLEGGGGGVGKVFFEYADGDDGAKARGGLDGRVFAGKEVAAEFYEEFRFRQGDYI